MCIIALALVLTACESDPRTPIVIVPGQPVPTVTRSWWSRLTNPDPPRGMVQGRVTTPDGQPVVGAFLRREIVALATNDSRL